MEAGKTVDLQNVLTSWRPRNLVLVWVLRPENQESQRHSSIAKAAGLRLRKSLCFSLSLKGGGKTYGTGRRQSGRRYSLLFSRNQPSVLFRPSVDGMRPTHISESNLLYSVIYSGVSLLI